MVDERNSGFVSLVGAGPGDPGLVTIRGIQRLIDADVIVFDRLANPNLLTLAPQAEKIPVGKQPGCHPVPQEEINKLLIEKARLGQSVVRLKGGDPFVFGRGGEEAMALKEAGIQFEVVPGVTSAVAAPAYAGIPVTHRGKASSVAFITGHRKIQTDDSKGDWFRQNWKADTLVFLMGVKNLSQIAKQLIAAGKPGETPAALIEGGTYTRQKTITGTLGDIMIKGSDIKPPAIFIVGEVVGLRDEIMWYESTKQRPLLGQRILSTKSLPPQEINKVSTVIPPLDYFSEQVRKLGGEVIHLPVFQIVSPSDSKPLMEAIQRLKEGGAYDWVVFTSVNGVRFTFDQLFSMGADSRCLKGVKIASIGPVTARALNQFGLNSDFLPSRYTGKNLAIQIPINPGDRFLLPRSDIALPELPNILRERNGIVDEVSAYSVKPTPIDVAVLDQLMSGQIDIVTFFSPSGLYGLNKIISSTSFNKSMEEILRPVTVVCIGPTTREAALGLGLRVDLVAQEHTVTGMIQELIKHSKLS